MFENYTVVKSKGLFCIPSHERRACRDIIRWYNRPTAVDIFEDQSDIIFVQWQSTEMSLAGKLEHSNLRGTNILQCVPDKFLFAVKKVAVQPFVKFLAIFDWKWIADWLSGKFTNYICGNMETEYRWQWTCG